MTVMTAREFARILARDGERCVHCGAVDGLVPHHRMNRGMGGSKALEVPSNVLTMCSRFNALMESETWAQTLAIGNGWKLDRVNPDLAQEVLLHAGYWDWAAGAWFVLDNEYQRIRVTRDYGKD
jgi:hypothetical protein